MKSLYMMGFFLVLLSVVAVHAEECNNYGETRVCRQTTDTYETQGFCETTYIDGYMVKNYCLNTATGGSSTCLRAYESASVSNDLRIALAYWGIYLDGPTIGDWSCYQGSGPNMS
jgi:hypothetical protein